MKKLLKYLILLALLIPTNMHAQSSMTDEQVMQYFIKEKEAGTSQSQIVTSLLQRGVNVQQMQRVRRKYQRLQEGQGLGTADNKTGNDDRTRKNNASNRRTTDSQSATTADAAPYTNQIIQRERTTRHTYDENDEEYMLMMNEMNQIEPTDTAALYTQLLEQLKAKKRKVFGRDIFNNENLTFEPAMNIATPANYVLGPGDNVFVDIYGASQKTIQGTVSPEGSVTIEGFGPVQVGGMTVSQANAALRSQLGARYSSSKIKLTVGQTRTITVNVMGEVKVPGTYTLSSLATVFNALYMAGGTNDLGTLRNIRVFRNNRLIATCDIYGYIIDGDMHGNVRLQDNDVISVGPYDCLVNITGKVKRPMYYEMKKNESLATVLEFAGGFTGDAYKNSVRVIRKSGKMRSIYNVEEFDMKTFPIADEDSITVDSIINRYENMAEIKGAVFRPGMYQVGGNISSVRALIEAADGVTEEAFTAHAVMHRMKQDRTLKVIAIDVDGIMNGTSPDIPLESNDVLFIPTKQTMMENQTLTIHGEVQYPGIYKFASDETLEDFILQAGGLTEKASTVKVDVARRVSNPNATTTDSIIAKTYTFALKDGFVISGEPGFTLMPFDEVYVRKSPGYFMQKNVTVSGQATFTGTYTLSANNQRLSDLVKMAGGLNDRAFAAGARLERRYTAEERLRAEAALKKAKEELEANMTEMAAKAGNANISKISTTQQMSKFNIGDSYTVGIELDKALAHPGSAEDMELREGDQLIIPEYNSTVKINGEVMYPNTVGYKKGKSLKYYINQAGGYSNKAKKGHTYIIYQNGRVTKAKGGDKPMPGCEIVVPAKAISTTTMAEKLSVATSVGSFAAIIATIANILK